MDQGASLRSLSENDRRTNPKSKIFKVLCNKKFRLQRDINGQKIRTRDSKWSNQVLCQRAQVNCERCSLGQFSDQSLTSKDLNFNL